MNPITSQLIGKKGTSRVCCSGRPLRLPIFDTGFNEKMRNACASLGRQIGKNNLGTF